MARGIKAMATARNRARVVARDIVPELWCQSYG